MNTNSSIARFEGRLFADAGRLCLVLEANQASGIARVSCRLGGTQQVVEMPLAEVSKRIASGADLVIDNVSQTELSKRLQRKSDGWYFSVRGGHKGPFDSAEAAELALSQHVLSSSDS